MQEDLQRRDMEKIGGSLSRTPTRCRKNYPYASKSVACHFNLISHSHHNMTICSLSFHQQNTESRKNMAHKCFFQLAKLYSHGIDERLSLIYSQIYVSIFPPKAKLLFTLIETENNPSSSIRSDNGLTLETSAFQIFVPCFSFVV